MAKKAAGKTAICIFRTSPAIKAGAEKAAKAENRTVSNWLEELVRGKLATLKVEK